MLFFICYEYDMHTFIHFFNHLTSFLILILQQYHNILIFYDIVIIKSNIILYILIWNSVEIYNDALVNQINLIRNLTILIFITISKLILHIFKQITLSFYQFCKFILFFLIEQNDEYFIPWFSIGFHRYLFALGLIVFNFN